MSNNTQPQNTPTLPPLKYPASIVLVSAGLAFLAFLGINIVLILLLGREPIQNEDEAGAVAALTASLIAGLIGGVLVGIGSFIYQRIQVRAKHKARCEEMKAAHARAEAIRARAEADRARKEEEDRKRMEEEEQERRIYEECEFCGGDLEFSAQKGKTHESSYSDGYTLEVKTDTTGVIRENRKSYYLTTGTDSYRCPHCRYTVEVKHEEFNGLIRRNTDLAVYGSDEELPVSREQIRAGRLCSSFKILPSQIRF